MPDPLTSLLVGIVFVGAGLLLFWPEKGLVGRWLAMRRMSTHVLSEDALKTIYKAELKGQHPSLQFVAGALQIGTNQAAALLADMEQRELVALAGDRWELTPPGRDSALHVIRAHRLWERHLAEESGFAEAEWHQQADHAEHELTPEEADALDERLGHPIFDPHGDPIPTADGAIRAHGGRPLPSLAVGDTGRIVHVEDEPEAVYAQLVAEGVYPGMRVRLTEMTPQRVRFWANGDEHLLAPIVAANISVVPVAQEAEVQESSAENLTALKPGQQGRVTHIAPRCRGPERRRMMDLGILPGTLIQADLTSPSGDPTAYRIRGALIALRKEQANLIHITPISEATQ